MSLRDDDFTESGGAAALTSRGDTTGVTFTTLGVRAERRLTLFTANATLKGTLGWCHAFGDVVPTSTNAYAGSDAFIIAGAPIARDSAIIEAGFDLELSPESTFGLNYAGQLADSAQDHGFKANLILSTSLQLCANSSRLSSITPVGAGRPWLAANRCDSRVCGPYERRPAELVGGPVSGRKRTHTASGGRQRLRSAT